MIRVIREDISKMARETADHENPAFLLVIMLGCSLGLLFLFLTLEGKTLQSWFNYMSGLF
jgi:hypothetical protein